MSRDKSSECYSKAKGLLPGGVNSPARAWTAVGGCPLFLSRGSGSHVRDVDGNRYIDYVGSWGPLILGHSHPEVLGAIRESLSKGTSFGAPTEAESHLAHLIVGAFPSIDLVRFVNSGTEAAMSALRLSRAFTGRDKIVKFQGGYHGHVDALLVQSGSGAAIHGIPTSAGVSKKIIQDTLVGEYNDLSSVEELFGRYGHEIASVIVEPIAANMGVVLPQSGFLEGLRKLTSDWGSLLIFEEVVTGFRVGYGGAKQLLKIVPDITVLGKIIGGGLPVGAYGGRREIMEMVSPIGSMYQAGTLSGNPVAMEAGIKTLEILRRDGIYESLECISGKLANELLNICGIELKPVMVNRMGSMMTLFFAAGEVNGWKDVMGTDKKSFSKFFHRMLDEGIYIPPSPLEAMFVSTAHSNEDIDKTIDSARAVLRSK